MQVLVMLSIASASVERTSLGWDFYDANPKIDGFRWKYFYMWTPPYEAKQKFSSPGLLTEL